MLDAIVEASPSPAAQPNLVIDGYSLESLATVRQFNYNPLFVHCQQR